jgi:5-formyltetrahydrofolate cyclo-ligase
MNEESRQTAPPGTGSEAKAALRADMRARRLGLKPDECATKSAAICEHLFSWELLAKARCVYAFWPLNGEVDLRPLVHRLRAQGVAVALPRSLSDGSLDFRLFSREDELKKGPFGVLEPSAEAPPAATSPDVVLVPALAVDLHGYRLGNGAGYYDRFLPHVDAVSISPIFDFGVVDHVPREAHDLAVQRIATESGLISTMSS